MIWIIRSEGGSLGFDDLDHEILGGTLGFDDLGHEILWSSLGFGDLAHECEGAPSDSVIWVVRS